MAVANTITNFQQTIWSASILRSLDKITSLRNHCNFQYEKDSKHAKEVKILSVNRPTIRPSVHGTAITREGATDSSQLLQINQYRYFNFEVEDIVKAQSVPGLMEALTDEAGKGLALEGDKYVAEVIKTAAAADEVEASEVITLTTSNAMASVEDGCLPEGDDAYYNILRTDKAVAFAEQIEKVEHYRPEDAFTDAVKGLYVFGAKIIRPDEIYVMKTAK